MADEQESRQTQLVVTFASTADGVSGTLAHCAHTATFTGWLELFVLLREAAAEISGSNSDAAAPASRKCPSRPGT